LKRSDATLHSGLMLAARITLAHFSVSSAIKLAKVGGREREHVATQGGKPHLDLGLVESRVDLLGELGDDLGRRGLRCADAEPETRFVARHKLPMVGISGNASERIAVVTARARSLPARMYWIDEGMVANMTCTCPARRSVSAGAAPR